MRNKIIKIDGAPGITKEGEKGITGRKGGMLFFTDNDSIDYFSIFDMWSNESINTAPLYIEKYNYCEYTVPEEYDYIITYSQNMAFVYIVEVLIQKIDLFNRENLDKYVESGKISKEYADNIYNYYALHHNEHDCCLVKKVSALNTALSDINSVNILNIDVTVSLDELPYVGYSNEITVTRDTAALNTTDKTVKYLLFNISAESSTILKDIKIEAEFYKNSINGELCSILPELWENPVNTNLNNGNYPIGYIENYNYDNNFDNENLGNFILVLKEKDDEATNIYTSKIKIPESMVEEYHVCIYAYCDTNSGINKIYIGDFSITDLLED